MEGYAGKNRHIPINILLGTDSLSDGALALSANGRSERKLDEYTADGIVLVELLYDIDYLRNFCLLWNLDVLESDADFLSSLRLHAHVDRRVRARASLNDSKLRFKAGMLGLQGLDPARNLFANGSTGIA